jgi:Holliday junction resolvasome RuvABC ATP-dependent DNA helicase subunit
MLVAPKGAGKTLMAKSFARNLLFNGKPKPLLEINCASIKNLASFINDVIAPYCVDENITLFMDECSELPKDVTMSLLTMLNPNKDNMNVFNYKDFSWAVDFRKITFLFATTEAQDIFHALMDRCERIDLQEYTHEELGEIVKMAAEDIKFSNDNLVKEIASTLRGSGREAFKMARKLSDYCKNRKKKTFNKKDWLILRQILDILPLGISRIELQLMRILLRERYCRLTNLAAKMGLTRACVQKDGEIFLQRNDLIEIDPRGRVLTKWGKELLVNINKNYDV